MKQASQNQTERKPLAIHMSHRIREGLLILSIAIAVFLFVSFASYHATDPSWSSTGYGNKILNWGGRAGAFFADIFLSLFGFIAYLMPVMIVFAAWLGAKHKKDANALQSSELILKGLGFVFIVLSGCGLIALFFKHHLFVLPASSGGMLGDITAEKLIGIFNVSGSSLFLITALLCGTTLFTGISWLGLIDAVGFYTTHFFVLANASIKNKTSQLKFDTKKILSVRAEPKMPDLRSELRPELRIVTPPKIIAPKVSEPAPVTKPKSAEKKIESMVTLKPGMLPPLSLLNPAPPSEGKAFSKTTFEELSQLVEQRLLDFGVEVKVVAVHPGPIITRFELDLAPGIKVSKITGLAKDIARSLSVTSVRVVEVIPGKSVIGLELPNEHRELVALRDVLESQRYIQSKSPVSLVLGKDIAGFPVVVDLAKMPHLLVAGTTGSGKSVSINAMLLSMLYKATPEQLRLILIDPKMLELSVYEGIPHLINTRDYRYERCSQCIALVCSRNG